jgi:hypothetical protein
MLANVLAMRSLDMLTLTHVRFENDQTTDVLLEALAASSLRDLSIYNWVVPPSKTDDLARTLARSRLQKLAYESLTCPGFLRTLSEGLKETTSSIQALVLGSFYDANYCYLLKSDELRSFFRGSQQWHLAELTLYIQHWDKAFDLALASYVRNNAHLLKLCVHLDPEYSGSEISSDALADAVDSGGHFAGTIELEGRFVSGFQMRLRHLLEVNRQRLLHGPRLLAIVAMKDGHARQESLLKATELFELTMLYEFVRRGDWSLQTLIRESCGV